MDFKAIIDFLLEKYNIKQDIDCEVFTNSRGPSAQKGIINLGIGSSSYQLSYQFAHELTHIIQESQGRGNNWQVYPPLHENETEAVANALWVMGKLFGLNWYLDEIKKNPDRPGYYDYTEAFRLLETNELEKRWDNFKNKV